MEYKLAVSSGADSLPKGELTGALLSAMLIDELTGVPVRGATVKPIIFRSAAADSSEAPIPAGSSSRPLGVSIKEIGNGLYGLIGRPDLALPRLATDTYSIGIQILAEGYCPHKAMGQITAHTDFPESFTPLHLGTIELHRQPVTIQGTIVKRSREGFQSVAGARARVTGIWRQLPSASVVSPPEPANILSTTSALSNSYKAPSSEVFPVTLSETAPDPVTLATSAAAGSYVITLDGLPALTPGNLISLSPDDSARDELHEVLSHQVASFDSVELRLGTPLAWSHRAGTRARVMTITHTGPANSLSIDAAAGDRMLFCKTLSSIEDMAAVKVSSGPSSSGSEKEYHWIRLYDVHSDSDGFYRLPPISRIAQMRIDTDLDGDVAATRVIAPRYPAYEQQIDFILPE